jgi:adenylate cyclase
MEGLTRVPPPVRPRSEDVRGARGRANLLIVAPVVLILLPLLFFEPFRLVEARLFDLFSTIFALRPPEPGVVIIAIDEPAFAEIGQRWPWPRALHARLTRSLREAGATAIGFDIIFAEPATEAADRAFAAALGRDVVLAADEAETTMDHATQTTRVGPVAALTETGATSGLTSVDLDGDGYLRRLPGMADGFAAEALRIAGAPARQAPEGALIQYFGPPRSYPTYSYYQALDPARFLPPGSLKDRIVFVGLSLKAAARPDSGAPDTFLTPYTLASGQATAGVEVQATVLDNLRHGLFILPVSRSGAIGFAIAAALLAALLGRKISWASAGLSLLALVGLIAGSWALLRFGRLWAPPALPAGAFLSVFGTRLALDFIGERRLRRRVSEAFARYISPELVAQLARNPASLKLGGERRNLTILFCDVRGFTSLSERLKDRPERLTALVNRLLDPLSGAILAEAGTIDKYIGDCVMAFWNAPLPCPDHPARAVAAAFRMIEAVEALNLELQSEAVGKGEQPPRFAVGIGINSGDCVVGNVGSRWRYDYSVLGDTVNLASRLEGLSKEYGVSIVLGPDTASAVAGHFALIELDRIAVRGRASE